MDTRQRHTGMRLASDLLDSEGDATSQDGSQASPPGKRVQTMKEWPEWWKDEWALFKVEKDENKRRQQWSTWSKEFKTCAIRAAGGWRRDELILWQRQDLEAAARANAAASRARRMAEAASSPPPGADGPQPPQPPPPAALEPASHAWTEGARIGEASNPGPVKDDMHAAIQGTGAIHRRSNVLPRPGRRAVTQRGSLLVYARGRGYNRSGRGPTALRTRSRPEYRQGHPSHSPSSRGDPCSLPAVHPSRAPPPHDLARDGDVHPNPGPHRRSSRRPSPPSQRQHQPPSGSHVPARSYQPAQAPAGQRDARAVATSGGKQNQQP